MSHGDSEGLVTVTLEILRLMQMILVPCAFVAVMFFALNLFETFPKEKGAKLPPRPRNGV
ncbi:hypothetical protein SAMN05216219_0904 [Mycetocola miduiensis]|uniref:Uncharacterized protein n=1 Tax=Mycetocola miduiensis TaxID=995034 RepID=A0A1I4ZLD9_9MICO|nr:hypothetical protein SAMN05216219_0904 [Mycetocola miduiensis]